MLRDTAWCRMMQPITVQTDPEAFSQELRAAVPRRNCGSCARQRRGSGRTHAGLNVLREPVVPLLPQTHRTSDQIMVPGRMPERIAPGFTPCMVNVRKGSW